jgi:ATP-dependent DNA helicase RecG
MDILDTSLEYLKGIGPNRAQLIKKELNIKCFRDLLYYFPIRYIDRSKFYRIDELTNSKSEVQIKGKIEKIYYKNYKNGKRLIATLNDNSGKIELVWFRGYKWIEKKISIDTNYVVFGKLSWFMNTPNIIHPEITNKNEYENVTHGKIYPIYSLNENLISKGINQKILRKSILSLFEKTYSNFKETLPEKIISELNLISKSKALTSVHFPNKIEEITKATNRLKFEELFYLQIQLLIKNKVNKTKIKGFNFNKVDFLFNTFYKKHLDFELTESQKKVIREIRNDMGSGNQMNRLLQGDVGSGKTIVAFFSILIALDNNYQSCLMAPTEVLSKQHYESFVFFSKKLNIKIAILTGSTKSSDKKKVIKNLFDGKIDILIGTHALIEEKIKFKNLGLAIIDEQHKFGVAQRSKLWKKNFFPPHMLIMTATPIPRTLAMTAYGDLDISIIDELPKGRLEIKTFLKSDSKRLEIFNFIKKQINEGRQIYIVYPLIEESKKMDYKDLMDGYESISREFPLPKYKISILHGKMKYNEKKVEMKRFIKGETQIMVATTVIEVGVNIPNASVMIIESAEKFGLSQLHQLRGRVGRGNFQSYCILVASEKKSNEAKVRLETMKKSNDGFEIADVDLKLRGPGNIMGTEQSGILNLKIADLINDNDLLIKARKFALNILNEDPELRDLNNIIIRNTYKSIIKKKNIWNYIG